MKYLAIILICLFAVSAFADYDKDFPPLQSEIVYVQDTPAWKPHEPTPINRSSGFDLDKVFDAAAEAFEWIVVLPTPDL